ncbi:hypothetical protein H8B06_05930 [Sphingobacterium sp. DN00404]|uniref:HTH cro/C1-type domain-containing protein n=1 Tax=Sphingobacterium micropteri TaxID=2763501 RepID=A0ABR7YM00_9SPHI|nr:hypothetical protein [Sphingobacterium micropteri]MBD1432356.1 hypothetical protein [Sphingobacterium micropteri]
MDIQKLIENIDKEKFAIKFQVHREISGISTKEAAVKLNVEENEIVAIENANGKITPELVKNTAVLFKTDVSSLLSSSTNLSHFEHVYSSPINSTFHTFKSTDEKQSEAILLLIDNVTSMSNRITELLEQK